MVRTTVGTIAEAELSVQQAESVNLISASQTATVSSSGSQTTTVTAPSGTVLTVVGLQVVIDPPPGATTGNHTIQVKGPNEAVSYLLARSTFDQDILINNSVIATANDFVRPGSPVVQSQTIRSIRADDTDGISLVYDNDTDVDQTERRTIRLLVLERGVTS
jgi:hypothetical protein